MTITGYKNQRIKVANGDSSASDAANQTFDSSPAGLFEQRTNCENIGSFVTTISEYLSILHNILIFLEFKRTFS
ncbi:unnamed protein product [Schistosoma rodhaini]|uniref:Uncharacterized protein n=1 Tax=Schistosoma rodhaini TaxID=6188 RepID=A0AA85FQU8_9TREM|nr:unnamed protein product [Schistosoma rodhaini]